MSVATGGMRGRSVMLTGFTAGVGRASAFALAEMGADLHLLCRSAEKGQKTLDAIRKKIPDARLTMGVGDLGNLGEVRRMASEFLELDKELHVLFNNAGVVNQKHASTVDGYEETFAVNHLGHFLLTLLLLERMRDSDSARVVSTASDAHRLGGPIDFDDLQAQKSYSTFGVYGRSKLANILFIRELAKREAPDGLCAYAFHPGFVGSDFSKNNGILARTMMTLLSPFARSPERGADTGVYLCSAEKIEAESGTYFHNRKPVSPAEKLVGSDDARRLWDVSLELTSP